MEACQVVRPTKSVGPALCYYLLKPNGCFIARSIVWPITVDGYSKYPKLKEEMWEYNKAVKESIGAFDDWLILQTEVDELEKVLVVPVPEGGMPNEQDKGFNEPETGQGFDLLIQAEVILPPKGGDMMAKVVGWSRMPMGILWDGSTSSLCSMQGCTRSSFLMENIKRSHSTF